MAERHGMCKTRVYKLWASMKARCNISTATGYENYGGRGIAVCDRWESFLAFYEDMGEPPTGYSLDRVNPDGHYEPDNCRWVPIADQLRNQRDLVYMVHNGKRQCLSVWARELGVPDNTLRSRIRYGWPVEKILTTPARAHKPYQRGQS